MGMAHMKCTKERSTVQPISKISFEWSQMKLELAHEHSRIGFAEVFRSFRAQTNKLTNVMPPHSNLKT